MKVIIPESKFHLLTEKHLDKPFDELHKEIQDEIDRLVMGYMDNFFEFVEKRGSIPKETLSPMLEYPIERLAFQRFQKVRDHNIKEMIEEGWKVK